MMLLFIQPSFCSHRASSGWRRPAAVQMIGRSEWPQLTYEQHMELKERLLQYMCATAYVKLAPSSIAGVGVFALRDIPAAVDPFAAPNSQLRRPEPTVLLTVAELARLPQSVYEHALSFFPAADADESGQTQRTDAQGNFMYEVPANGFAAFDASWYVNHAEEEEANVAFSTADPAESGFRTLRAVREGEELLMDYRHVFPDLYAKTVAPHARRSSSPRMCATTSAPAAGVAEASAGVVDESVVASPPMQRPTHSRMLTLQAVALLIATLLALGPLPASADENYLPSSSRGGGEVTSQSTLSTARASATTPPTNAALRACAGGAASRRRRSCSQC